MNRKDFEDNEDLLYDEYGKEIFENKFSDNLRHKYIDISYFERLMLHKNSSKRLWYRFQNKLERFPIQYAKTKLGYDIKYIVVDEILSLDENNIKNSFFKKSFPIFIGTTKESIINFFNKYGKKSMDKETIKLFLDKWEDGMIFIAIY